MRALFSGYTMTYFWGAVIDLTSFADFMLQNKLRNACITWPEECGVTPKPWTSVPSRSFRMTTSKNACAKKIRRKFCWWHPVIYRETKMEAHHKAGRYSSPYLSEAALSVHYLYWGQWEGSLCTRWFRDLGSRWRHTAWWPFECAPPLWAEGPCQCWGSLVEAGPLWKQEQKVWIIICESFCSDAPENEPKRGETTESLNPILFKTWWFFSYKSEMRSIGAYVFRIALPWKVFLAQITLDKCSSGAWAYSQPCTKASS